MSLLRLYTRVLELLGKEARLGWILAVANLLLATAQFAEPVLFGKIIDVMSGRPVTGLFATNSPWPLLAAWVAFGLFTIVCSAVVALHADLPDLWDFAHGTWEACSGTSRPAESGRSPSGGLSGQQPAGWPGRRSTACAMSLVSGQLSFQASGTVVMVEPWLQLKAMTPSFMRLPPNSRARAV